VVTIGDEDSEKQLRTALAMGADKAVLFNTEDDLEDGDQFTTAKILETFFEDKEADLILAGNVAIDESSGQVGPRVAERSEEHTSELQSRFDLVCRLLLEKKKQI